MSTRDRILDVYQCVGFDGQHKPYYFETEQRFICLNCGNYLINDAVITEYDLNSLYSEDEMFI